MAVGEELGGRGSARAVQALLDARRPHDAVRMLAGLVAADPDDQHLRVLQGQAFLRIGDHDRALEAADAVVRLAPHDEAGFRLRALALIGKGKKGAALEAARTAVELDPYSLNAHIVRADAASARRRMKEARAAAEKARELAPCDAAGHVTLSLVAARSMRWKEAEQHARAALAIDPEDLAAFNNLGVALGRLGRRREAVPYLGEASKLDPQESLAHKNARAIAAGSIGGILLFSSLARAVLSEVPDTGVVLVLLAAVAIVLVSRARGIRMAHKDPRAPKKVMRELQRQAVQSSLIMRTGILVGSGVFIAFLSALMFLSTTFPTEPEEQPLNVLVLMVCGVVFSTLAALCFREAWRRRRRPRT